MADIIVVRWNVGNEANKFHQRQLVDRSSPFYKTVGHRKITRWRSYLELTIQDLFASASNLIFIAGSRKAKNSSRLPMNLDGRLWIDWQARQPFKPHSL